MRRGEQERVPPVQRGVEPEVPGVHYPLRRLLLFLAFSFLSLCRSKRDVKNQNASSRTVVGVNKRHLETSTFLVWDHVRLPHLEGDDAVGVLDSRGVVEDEGRGDRGAVDGAGAEAAGEAFESFLCCGERERSTRRRSTENAMPSNCLSLSLSFPSLFLSFTSALPVVWSECACVRK